jgi:hypothetical protein
MRRIRRILLFSAHLVYLLVGFFLSFALGLLLQRTLSFLAGCLLGLISTGLGSMAIRRLAGPGGVKYDLAASKRRLSPSKRILVCVPSAIVAFVFFFFPIATHLSHPRSPTLTHYRIPVPWNFAVLPSSSDTHLLTVIGSTNGKARYGMTPRFVPENFGDPPTVSEMIFTEYEYFSVDRPPQKSQFTIRDLDLGYMRITCLQPVRPVFHTGSPSAVSVFCETFGRATANVLIAKFLGAAQDLPAFYRIIEGIQPLN